MYKVMKGGARTMSAMFKVMKGARSVSHVHGDGRGGGGGGGRASAM